MKDCILFLNGSYRSNGSAFYLKLARGKFTVAVDGGYGFFRKTKTFPDLLIGDFDSIKVMPRNLPARTLVRQYPRQKDKTDAELALDYCIEAGAKKIDIVQPSYGEPDQLLGNFLLLSLVTAKVSKLRMPSVRLVNLRYEVLLLTDSSFTILNGVGDTVSVIPLSDTVALSATGSAFNVRGVEIKRGRSLGMRNRVAKARARFTISGTALLIHQFRKRQSKPVPRAS